MKKARGSFYSGTSNIVLPLRQSEFPPEYQGASRLTYYAALFSSVEINATFYKLPRPATIGKWAESVPEGFRFTFKVPKTVTHGKGLQFEGAELLRFCETIAPAFNHRGCLLVQLPPSTKRECSEELDGLLEGLAHDAPGWPVAVEFRNNSWYERSAYRLLERYGASLVQQDLPASATPAGAPGNDVVYLRYHGPESGYRGSYSNGFLEGEAGRIRTHLAAGKTVYAYFNNTLGAALQNLQTLNALVGR